MSPSPQRPDRDVALRALASALAIAAEWAADARDGVADAEHDLMRLADMRDLAAHHLAAARERED